jgi:prepilin-type processing-associated H-X9-DG protein
LNNLRQIGIGLHGYITSLDSLPLAITPTFDRRYSPAFDPQCDRWEFNDSFLTGILPYLEQVPIYNATNLNLYVLSIDNRTVAATSVATYICPSDSDVASPISLTIAATIALGYEWDGSPGIGRTSYAGFGGSLTYFAIPSGPSCSVPSQWSYYCNGGFGADTPVKLSSFTDGTSNTMLVGERSLTKLQPFDSYLPDYYRSANIWISSNIASTLLTAFWGPNQPQDNSSGVSLTQRTWSASSMHQGGLNVLMMDGSVRFIKNSISTWTFNASSNPIDYIQGRIPTGVWQRLATRSGGELIDGDGY